MPVSTHLPPRGSLLCNESDKGYNDELTSYHRYRFDYDYNINDRNYQTIVRRRDICQLLYSNSENLKVKINLAFNIGECVSRGSDTT